MTQDVIGSVVVDMTRFVFLLVVCMTAAQSQSADLPDREKDVYRVYSLLMTNPRTSHGPDDNPRYLIAATTRAEQRQPCVNAPPSHARDLAEALADFEARRANPRTVKPSLSLQKPYELLTDPDVKAFQAERNWPKPHIREGDPRFKGITDVFTLSDVYFSKNGRIVLTAISSWCGGLCGQHQWKVLEKLSTGEWCEQPSWVSCFTIARLYALSPFTGPTRFELSSPVNARHR